MEDFSISCPSRLARFSHLLGLITHIMTQLCRVTLLQLLSEMSKIANKISPASGSRRLQIDIFTLVAFGKLNLLRMNI